MKRLEKVIIIIFCYSILTIIVDSCKPCPNSNYDIDKINLANVIYDPGNCRDCYYPYKTDTAILKFSNYGLRIEFHNIIYSSILNKSSLTQDAMAMDCWVYYTIQHKIESIKIYTLNNFDNYHKSNTEISNYFKAIDDNSHSSPKLTSIDSALNDKDFINYSHIGNIEHLDLLLQKSPKNDSLFRFVVNVKLTNNELIDTTETIKIIK